MNPSIGWRYSAATSSFAIEVIVTRPCGERNRAFQATERGCGSPVSTLGVARLPRGTYPSPHDGLRALWRPDLYRRAILLGVRRRRSHARRPVAAARHSPVLRPGGGRG